ncbi:MAG: peptidoglycan editing factor PgeF [Candidatus Hydrogenedentes bacterium]|nr:peptidoglycan editing factor PgeF [Candidatus Hydrogenedentota bacterium]
MIRFQEFERLGVSAAACSDQSDGDCRVGEGCNNIENVRRFCTNFGIEVHQLVQIRQVHGNRVIRLRQNPAGGGAESGIRPLADADGLMTDVPGQALAVFVADCVPVFLYDPKRRVGGLLHAGRQGSYSNISGHAIETMASEFGSHPADVHALLGPSAGPCCYEVSPELAKAFAAKNLPVNGRYLDLWETNAQQLTAAGVPLKQIIVPRLCTICSGRFHSYRAHKTPARNMAVLVL